MTEPTDVEAHYATPGRFETRVDLHARFGVNAEGWHRWVRRRLDLRPGSRVLELGCGTGALWRDVEPPIPGGVRLVLCDRSEGMLDAARRALSHVTGTRFERIDLDGEFTLPDEPDVLVCNHVLYHVRDPRATLARLRSALAPGTRCVFGTNGRDNMATLERSLPSASARAIADLIAGFTLESGYALVRDVFGDARVARYADALAVTDADALADYVASLPVALSADVLRTLREQAAAHIEAHGSLHVNKDVGLIETSA